MLPPRWTSTPNDAESAALRRLLLAAAASDGWPNLTSTGPLPPELDGGPYLLGFDPHGSSEQLVAVARLNEDGDAFGRQVAEVIVHPEHRRHGHGAAVLAAVQARATRTLRAWSHNDHPGAAALASRFGFTRVRELHRMGVDLPAEDAAKAAFIAPNATNEAFTAQLPDGVRLRTIEPGVDEQAVVEVNARAFSWHPEQGAMTVDDLRAAEAADGFDPEGFFVAEREQRLLGFHWTKIHPGDEGKNAVGEVYVVGVDPDAHGGGLGRALTVAGLNYLQKRGLTRVILYVEGDNEPALAVYRRLGFEVEQTAVQYEHTVVEPER